MSVCKDVICVVGCPSWDIPSANYNLPLVKKVKLFFMKTAEVDDKFCNRGNVSAF